MVETTHRASVNTSDYFSLLRAYLLEIFSSDRSIEEQLRLAESAIEQAMNHPDVPLWVDVLSGMFETDYCFEEIDPNYHETRQYFRDDVKKKILAYK